jgi:hypothetical protein
MLRAVEIGLSDAANKGITSRKEQAQAVVSCVELAMRLENEDAAEPAFATPVPSAELSRPPQSNVGPPSAPVLFKRDAPQEEPGPTLAPTPQKRLIVLPGEEADHSSDALPLGPMQRVSSLRKPRSGQVHDGESIRNFLEANTPESIEVHPVNRPDQTITLRRHMVMEPGVVEDGTGYFKTKTNMGVKVTYFHAGLGYGDTIADVSAVQAVTGQMGATKLGIDVSQTIFPEDMDSVSIPDMMAKFMAQAEHKFSEKPAEMPSKIPIMQGQLNIRDQSHYAARTKIAIDHEGNQAVAGLSSEQLRNLVASIKVRPE